MRHARDDLSRSCKNWYPSESVPGRNGNWYLKGTKLTKKNSIARCGNNVKTKYVLDLVEGVSNLQPQTLYNPTLNIAFFK